MVWEALAPYVSPSGVKKMPEVCAGVCIMYVILQLICTTCLWNIHTLCIHHFKKKRSVADASLTQVWRSTLFSTIRPLRLGPAPRLEVVALQVDLELLEIVEDSNFNRCDQNTKTHFILKPRKVKFLETCPRVCTSRSLFSI